MRSLLSSEIRLSLIASTPSWSKSDKNSVDNTARSGNDIPILLATIWMIDGTITMSLNITTTMLSQRPVCPSHPRTNNDQRSKADMMDADINSIEKERKKID